MKKMMALLMLCPVLAFSQGKIALIDPALRRPITYVSSMKMEHLLNGSFALGTDNMKAFVDKVKEFRGLIDGKKDLPENMKSVILGSTYFTVSGKNGDFNIVLDSKIDKMGTYFVLADKKNSRKDNIQRIDDFLAYLDK